MTKEDKELLLKDLCARLPYDVVVRCYFVDGGGEEGLDTDDIADLLYNEENSEFPMYKPYLRSMSSMTDEEKIKYQQLKNQLVCQVNTFNNGNLYKQTYKVDLDEDSIDIVDWLNKHHFDYRGLIEKGLALEAPKDMYK